MFVVEYQLQLSLVEWGFPNSIAFKIGMQVSLHDIKRRLARVVRREINKTTYQCTITAWVKGWGTAAPLVHIWQKRARRR